jgi:hypothetical protein
MDLSNYSFAFLERLEEEVRAEINSRILDYADKGITDLGLIRQF